MIMLHFVEFMKFLSSKVEHWVVRRKSLNLARLGRLRFVTSYLVPSDADAQKAVFNREELRITSGS